MKNCVLVSFSLVFTRFLWQTHVCHGLKLKKYTKNTESLNYGFFHKVKKIQEECLDLISSPSPSAKIQIIGGKIWLRCKGITLLGLSTNFWKQKVCWHSPAMFCLITYPANNLNFHWRWRWWDQIQAIVLNLFYYTKGSYE